jgi:hypothetical protein
MQTDDVGLGLPSRLKAMRTSPSTFDAGVASASPASVLSMGPVGVTSWKGTLHFADGQTLASLPVGNRKVKPMDRQKNPLPVLISKFDRALYNRVYLMLFTCLPCNFWYFCRAVL